MLQLPIGTEPVNAAVAVAVRYEKSTISSGGETGRVVERHALRSDRRYRDLGTTVLAQLHQNIAVVVVLRHLVRLVVGKPDVVVLVDE